MELANLSTSETSENILYETEEFTLYLQVSQFENYLPEPRNAKLRNTTFIKYKLLRMVTAPSIIISKLENILPIIFVSKQNIQEK